MTELEIFDSPEFGEIRTVTIDHEYWFVGKDAAEALKYTNPQKAIRDHVDEEDRTVNESFTVNGTMVVLINESGLYSLIFSSNLPTAKRFKHWVTSEVLPSLRKTGTYTMPELRVLESKAALFDRLSGGHENKNFRDSAKALDISQSQLIGWLKDNHMIYKREDGTTLPTPEFENSGFFAVRNYRSKYSGYDGVRTLITQTGLSAFSHMLDAAGFNKNNMKKHGGNPNFRRN